ncbi:MAG: glycoside hydrolase family 105 protein [Thermoanaerobaculia bacterium]
MRARAPSIGLLVALTLSAGCGTEPRELGEGEDPLAADRIQEISRKVADWQLAHSRREALEWTNAVFYSGVMAVYRLTGDDRYRAAMLEMGERNRWRLGSRFRHADDHAVAQTYLELYRLESDPRMHRAFRLSIERMIAEPPDWPKPHQTIDYWWADALFMSPPALALLAEATGDEKYLALLDRLWRETHELLFDEAQGLYYRDLRFRNEAEPRFWSRGNGWVLAGLARLLEVLPAERGGRGFYEETFRRLATRVVALQGSDGLWRSDLHGTVTSAPGESSGSALFCYALAWGVNRGLLTSEEAAPAARRAWVALYRNVDERGRLGWVQEPGAKPGSASSRDREPYGSGAFLLAAEQIAKLEGP